MNLNFGKLKQIAQAQAQENWMYGTAKQDLMTKEERAEWLTEALHEGDALLWAVWFPGPDGIIIPAVTGDGPRAEQAAAFISTFNPPTVLALLDRAVEAEATIQRVRELHQDEDGYCVKCSEEYGLTTGTYPCPPIQALEGDEA